MLLLLLLLLLLRRLAAGHELLWNVLLPHRRLHIGLLVRLPHVLLLHMLLLHRPLLPHIVTDRGWRVQ